MAAKQRVARKKHIQLTLDQARKPEPGKHGGWRPGAGRKKKVGAVSHDTRPSERADIPQHVTVRIADGVTSLARDGLMKIIRRAIKQSHKDAFKVHDFNVLGNHLHLITTAADKRALSGGVAGLEVRLAYRLNAALSRSGKLFAQRYHARHLKTPREVRNALRYVLLNRKHHAAEKKFAKLLDRPLLERGVVRWLGAAHPRRRAVEARAVQDGPADGESDCLAADDGLERRGPLRFDERPS